MEQEFRLFHHTTELGLIQTLGQESTSAYGKIKLSPEIENGQGRINEYIKYCIEADKLLEKEEALYLEFIEKEEIKFIDLIQSAEWKLIDSTGGIHEILIPLFRNNGEVIWRWQN